MDINDIKARLRELDDQILRANEDTKASLEEARTKVDGVAPGLTGDILIRYENADAIIAASEREMEVLKPRLEALRSTAEVVEESAAEAGESVDEHRAAFDKWVREGLSELDGKQRATLRAQASDPGSAGGFLIHPDYWARLSKVMKAYGGLEGISRVITTAKGNDLTWPTSDSTNRVGEILNENTAANEEDIDLGQRSLGAFKFSSKMVRIPIELMQDDEIGIEDIVLDELGERLGRIHNQYWTTGIGGGSEPQGILNGVTPDVTAQAAIPTHDELIELIYGLDPAYMTGRERFSFNHATAGVMRRVVDGQGNKVWTPGLSDSQPARLLGFEYTINQNMPNFSTGNVPVLFGDHFEAFIIRKVREATIKRLDERYAEFHQVAFLGYSRMDSVQDNMDALRVMNVL